MTQPLALVVYENLLPGSQLVNRLQDLKYRVRVLSDLGQLIETAVEAKPMVVFMDLEAKSKDPCAAIKQLKENSATSHLPVVGFMMQSHPELEQAARNAGATAFATESVLLNHLDQLLEQALEIR